MVELLIPHKEKRKEKVKEKAKAKPKVTVKKKKKEKKVEEEQPKSWLDRARDFGKRIGRKDTKVTTRTTSK